MLPSSLTLSSGSLRSFATAGSLPKAGKHPKEERQRVRVIPTSSSLAGADPVGPRCIGISTKISTILPLIQTLFSCFQGHSRSAANTPSQLKEKSSTTSGEIMFPPFDFVKRPHGQTDRSLVHSWTFLVTSQGSPREESQSSC